MSEQSKVMIIIYDSKGNKVKTIFNEDKAPNSYTYDWYGKDDSGKKLGSGIYMVYMKAGGYEETKKIAIIK